MYASGFYKGLLYARMYGLVLLVLHQGTAIAKHCLLPERSSCQQQCVVSLVQPTKQVGSALQAITLPIVPSSTSFSMKRPGAGAQPDLKVVLMWWGAVSVIVGARPLSGAAQSRMP